jgi:hypothetical protein
VTCASEPSWQSPAVRTAQLRFLAHEIGRQVAATGAKTMALINVDDPRADPDINDIQRTIESNYHRFGTCRMWA